MSGPQVAKRIRKQGTGGRSPGATLLLSPQDTARRLGVVAAVFAVLTGLAFLLSLFAPESLGWHNPPQRLFLMRVMHFLLMALSIGLFALSRSGMPSEKLLSIGLVYQILGAFVICLPGYYCNMMLQARMDRLTWLAPWIIVFPILVPVQPRRCVLIALASATLAPLIFTCWLLVEEQSAPRLGMWLTTFAPNYLCAGLAVGSGVLVHSMKTEVAAAHRRIMELGSYQLVRKLGEGGMGEVWEAKHRMLARPAAIKLIQADLLSSPAGHQEFLTRFEREARITASLQSPHTIDLYDFGISDDGIVYYAMELLHGLDMDHLVGRHGPVPVARAIFLLRQVCRSLAEAHKAGLVHRDIKPANLYVCRIGDQYDFVKVMDFGLVRHVQHEGTDTRLTGVGESVGTPAFMAPEQVEGLPSVDNRADIYALGCVAYWLLTGHLVFEHKTAFHMMVDHVHKRPTPPSAVSPYSIPAEFEELILSCLEKAPVARPSSAEQLARGLDQLQQAYPWPQHRARTWWKRHGGGVTRRHKLRHP